MASGSFTSLSTSNQYIKGTLSWNSSVNVEGNYSTVTATLRIYRTNNYSTNRKSSFWIKINGNSKTTNNDWLVFSLNSNTLVAAHTVTVPHNADGTKSISITAGGTILAGTSGDPYSMSEQGGTVTLDTIPRASSISSFSDFVIGNGIYVSIARASSGFTHKLHLYVGGTFVKEWTGIGDSATLYLSDAEQNTIYSAIPNSTAVTMTLYCLTYSGGTQIGNWVSRQATAYVSDSIVPSFSHISHSEASSDVNSVIGAYVQGLSRLNLGIQGASGAKYSSISSYQITFDGSSYNSQSATSGVIKGSGNLTITGKITDSRGRTASKSITINALPYSGPKITVFSLARCNSNGTANDMGTYAKIVSQGNVSSLVNGSEKNSLTYRILSKKRNESSWVTKKSQTLVNLSLNASDVLGTYEAISSYDFRLEITDRFNTTIALNVLPTGQVAMSWSKQGIGVGKVWEQGALDVGGDIYANGIKQNGINSLPSGNGNDLSYWHNLRPGNYWCSPDILAGQPSNWGLVQVIKSGSGVGASDFTVLWFSQSEGAIYRKSGNASGMSRWYALSYDGHTHNYIPSDKSINAASGNFNNLLGTGFFDGDNAANAPNANWHYIFQTSHSNNPSMWKWQLASDFHNDNVYSRKLKNGSWTGWRRVLFDGDNVSAPNVYSDVYRFESVPGYVSGRNDGGFDFYLGTSGWRIVFDGGAHAIYTYNPSNGAWTKIAG